MNTEPTITDLYNLIGKLNDKIDRLERKVEQINTQTNNGPTWSTENVKSMIEWAKDAEINPEHMQCMFNMNINTIDAFKRCVLYNHDQSGEVAPFRRYRNRTYVMDDESKWVKWTDEHTRILITIIWQKFVGVELTYEHENDDIRMLSKKRVVGMRKELYEIKKNRVDINRWIGTIVQN